MTLPEGNRSNHGDSRKQENTMSSRFASSAHSTKTHSFKNQLLTNETLSIYLKKLYLQKKIALQTLIHKIHEEKHRQFWANQNGGR